MLPRSVVSIEKHPMYGEYDTYGQMRAMDGIYDQIRVGVNVGK